MGAIGNSPANLSLEEMCRTIWEALNGSMDAFAVNTGKPRPFPQVPWGQLTVDARVDFIESIAIILPALADAVRITYEVNANT